MATLFSKEAKYGRKLDERKPSNYPFFLRNDKRSYPDTYKEDFNYCIILIQNDKPIDARIVKTTETLENFIKDKHGRHKLDILFHPNPIKLKADFWEKYRKTKDGAERLKLFADKKVLVDSNMLFIDTITIDIDSSFEEAIKALNELTKELDIPAEILEVKKTKSGNLRFSFAIYPMKPDTLNKNGKTNLHNAKEFVNIINKYFKSKGLKADGRFKRINHPIWITKPEQVIFNATQEIDFYILYRKSKELYKRLKLQAREEKQRQKKGKLLHLPGFIANKLRYTEYKTALEKAVDTLAKTHKQGRYIHFLQPVAGWCKYLGLSYTEYYDLVYPYASDKIKDIEKAWKYARSLEFKNDVATKKKKYDIVEYADKVIDYLKKNGATERQVLLKEVFDNQKWLEQLVMQELKEQSFIREWFEKQDRGRPKKIYEFINIDTHSYDDINDESRDNQPSSLFIPANCCKSDFSQIITLSLESKLVVVGNRYDMFCLRVNPPRRWMLEFYFSLILVMVSVIIFPHTIISWFVFSRYESFSSVIKIGNFIPKLWNFLHLFSLKIKIIFPLHFFITSSCDENLSIPMRC